MKLSMLSKLVFSLLILSEVFFDGTGIVKLLEFWSVPALILMLFIDVAFIYIGLFLLLSGLKDALNYLKS